MESERRKGMAPVPEKLNEVLNDVQLTSLQKLEGFGWTLQFVRRPLFQEVFPVLFHPDNGTLGVMRGDGVLDTEPDIQLSSYKDSDAPDAPHQWDSDPLVSAP